MSVSCGTGTAAVESEGVACRLEAVFLCGLHTFVHLWDLAHVEPFWSHPTHATKGYPCVRATGYCRAMAQCALQNYSAQYSARYGSGSWVCNPMS